MNTINFEISKKLYEKWFLEFKQYEYSWFFRVDDEWNSLAICKHNNDYNEYLETYTEYPTLTLEDAIDFIQNKKYNSHKFNIDILQEYYSITIEFKIADSTTFKEKTLLVAMEQMIEYLIDNNLLKKWN